MWHSCAFFLKAGLVGGLLAMMSATASAQATEACRPFTVMSDGSNRSADTAEIDGSNIRHLAGNRSLKHADGSDAGNLYWFGTGRRSADDTGGVSRGTTILELSDGTIFYEFVHVHQKQFQDTSQRRTVPGIAGVVIGGTGAYKYARGMVTSKPDGKAVVYEIDIKCD